MQSKSPKERSRASCGNASKCPPPFVPLVRNLPSTIAGATWSAANGRDCYTGTSSSVSIRVHPWLLPREACREPVTTPSRFKQKTGKIRGGLTPVTSSAPSAKSVEKNRGTLRNSPRPYGRRHSPGSPDPGYRVSCRGGAIPFVPLGCFVVARLPVAPVPWSIGLFDRWSFLASSGRVSGLSLHNGG
jgi:hypothetical protein